MPEPDKPDKPDKDKSAEPAPSDDAPKAGKGTKSPFQEQSGGDGRDDSAAGGERSRALDDSLTMFGTRTSGVVVVGDGVTIGSVIGGDQYLTAGDELDRPILNLISDRIVAEVGRLYVEPQSFAALADPVSRDGLVLLGTRPRWGNTATAIQLLSGTKAIYELRYAGSLTDLPVDKLPAGSGFILEATEARVMIGLRPQGLADLEDRLRAAGTRLVVITDVERAAEHGGRPVWRALAVPPDAYEVTLRHLGDRLGSREQGAELLDQTEVADTLRTMTPRHLRHPPPRRVGRGSRGGGPRAVPVDRRDRAVRGPRRPGRRAVVRQCDAGRAGHEGARPGPRGAERPVVRRGLPRGDAPRPALAGRGARDHPRRTAPADPATRAAEGGAGLAHPRDPPHPVRRGHPGDRVLLGSRLPGAPAAPLLARARLRPGSAAGLAARRRRRRGGRRWHPGRRCGRFPGHVRVRHDPPGRDRAVGLQREGQRTRTGRGRPGHARAYGGHGGADDAAGRRLGVSRG